MTPTYYDFGVLGLDGFSNILDFKFDGVWNYLSEEEYHSFASRNPHMAIMDLNLDNNSYGNNILLSKCKNLQILRLRCSKDLGKFNNTYSIVQYANNVTINESLHKHI